MQQKTSDDDATTSDVDVISFSDLPGELDPHKDLFAVSMKCPFTAVSSRASELPPDVKAFKSNMMGQPGVVALEPGVAHEVFGWEPRGKGAPMFGATTEKLFGEISSKTSLGPMHREWRKQFRLPFSQKTLSNTVYTDLVEQEAVSCLENIKNASENEYVDPCDHTRQMAFNVGIRYLFGTGGRNDVNQFISDDTCKQLLQLMMLLSDGIWDYTMDETPGSAFWMALKARDEAHDILNKIIPQAREMFEKGELDENTALFQLFRDTWLLEDSDKVLAKETVNGIMFAATDTTSNAMATMLYHIYQNPQEFEKLKNMLAEDEIGKKLIDPSYELKSYEEINKTECLHWFIQESMRLVPSGAGVYRKSTRDNVLGGKYQVPPDTLVHVPTLYFHRNEKYFGENPNQFNFERMKNKEYDSKAFLPFGKGNRQCVGMQLAYLELKVFLLEYIRKDCKLDVDEASLWYGVDSLIFRANYKAKLTY